MEHQKELFIQFMENNMPSEPFDPDKVLAAAREAVPDYQLVRTIYKRHGQAAAKVQAAGEEGYCGEEVSVSEKRGASGCRFVVCYYLRFVHSTSK